MVHLKGLVRATRGARLVRRSSVSLSREAEEALFDIAQVLSEGGVGDADGARVYFGSTMISFDLGELETQWRGPLDDATCAEIARVVEGSVRLRIRLLRIARREALSRAGDRDGIGTATFETRVTRSGRCIHVDVDLEVPLGVSSRRSRR